MQILTATNKSKARFMLTEFYMRRKGKAYFRNKYGKTVTEDNNDYEYGKEYQFKINKLVRNEND